MMHRQWFRRVQYSKCVFPGKLAQPFKQLTMHTGTFAAKMCVCVIEEDEERFQSRHVELPGARLNLLQKCRGTTFDEYEWQC